MAGFTGAISFKSNGFTQAQKNKLLKNFQAFNQTNRLIEKDEFFLCNYSKKNCNFSLKKDKSLTLFYGRIDNVDELRKFLFVIDFTKHDFTPIMSESFSTNLQNLLISDLVQLLFLNLTGLISLLKVKKIKSKRVFKR